ncbi:MAG TPA: phospholipase D-like domain-containing protein, partial [Xanthobacteraceae bacterium]|nr:phospholipase D-like domain-containing protein [Xanthobacteraceae bacterium]
TITGQITPHVSAYFNKGIIAAQWVSRALSQVGKNAKLPDLIKTPDNPLRNALSGLLRPQLLALLDEVRTSNGEVYAALYELNDPELIAALSALGERCHLLLANGAFRPPANDENKAVRASLHDKVDLHNRLVASGHFAHNKFVVFCDAGGTPQRVLSGSTNWTVTGLCTQANNAIIIDDPNVAADFRNEWNLLKDAGNGYPPSLATANSQAKTFEVDGGRITQWFAPTSAAQDLDYARRLISAAKDGILFLFFNPGAFEPDDQPQKWTLLQNILVRHHEDSPDYDPALYMRGVVNQEIANLTTESTNGAKRRPILDPSEPANPVTLFSGGNKPPQRLNYESMVPKNIKAQFHNWMTEVLGTGVHIHSKVIVLDPFGANPVVMTGSHNLGYKASSKNDDNLVIVEGNAPLAAAFAANIIAIYQTYRWNAYVEAHRQDPQVWSGLVDSDAWQTGYLSGDDLAEIQFWLGQPAAAGAPSAARPPGVAAHTASATGPSPDQASARRPKGSGRKRTAPSKKTPAKSKRSAKSKAPAKKKPAARTKAPPRKKAAARAKTPVRRKAMATRSRRVARPPGTGRTKKR